MPFDSSSISLMNSLSFIFPSSDSSFDSYSDSSSILNPSMYGKIPV